LISWFDASLPAWASQGRAGGTPRGGRPEAGPWVAQAGRHPGCQEVHGAVRPDGRGFADLRSPTLSSRKARQGLAGTHAHRSLQDARDPSAFMGPGLRSAKPGW